MHTSPAVKVWDGTDIDRLAIHVILDGHAACNSKLTAMFADNDYPLDVTCKRCLKFVKEPHRH